MGSLLEVPSGLKGFTAHSYSMIMLLDDVKIDKIKTAWEKELGTEISEDVWTKALTRVNNSTSCARLGLIQFKVVHCWCKV